MLPIGFGRWRKAAGLLSHHHRPPDASSLFWFLLFSSCPCWIRVINVTKLPNRTDAILTNNSSRRPTELKNRKSVKTGIDCSSIWPVQNTLDFVNAWRKTNSVFLLVRQKPPSSQGNPAILQITTTSSNSDPVVYRASLPNLLPIGKVAERNYKGVSSLQFVRVCFGLIFEA